MCNKWTGLLLGGQAGFSAGSQIDAGKAAASESIEQARQLSQQAGAAQDAANAQAELIRRAARRQAAEAAAALAGSGVSVDAGTPLVINTEIQRGAESDALMTILGADRESSALQYESEALGKRAQAQRKAGYMNAMNSLLQSGANAMSASGWRSSGPGFSGTQAPAPISNRSIRVNS